MTFINFSVVSNIDAIYNRDACFKWNRDNSPGECMHDTKYHLWLVSELFYTTSLDESMDWGICCSTLRLGIRTKNVWLKRAIPKACKRHLRLTPCVSKQAEILFKQQNNTLLQQNNIQRNNQNNILFHFPALPENTLWRLVTLCLLVCVIYRQTGHINNTQTFLTSCSTLHLLPYLLPRRGKWSFSLPRKQTMCLSLLSLEMKRHVFTFFLWQEAHWGHLLPSSGLLPTRVWFLFF